MSLLPVTVIITTYDPDGSRRPLAEQTIQGLSKNLGYPNLHWIIADDGSPDHDDYMACLTQYVPAQTINVNRAGVGASKNRALELAFQTSHIVLLTEDDWYLPEPMDLVRHVQRMLDYPDIGIIRFGYMGGTTLEARYVGYTPFDTYWSLTQGSDVYVYSGQISLRSKVWYDTVGFHQEGVTPGDEELDMCIRYNGTPDAPKILWPAQYGCTLNAGPFKNIGLGNSLNSVQPEVK